MKDIDFDELDRAVNSLMGSVPKDDSVKKDEVPEKSDAEVASTSDIAMPESVTPETTATAEDIQPVVPMSPNSVASESNENDETEKGDDLNRVDSGTPSASASPAAPSRGRFMDMVRPSSRDSSRPFSSAVPSRQGVTLQPRSTQMTAGPTTTVQQVDDAANSTEEITTEVPDFSNFSLDSTEPMEDTTTSISETAQPEPTEDASPLNSPFLADAKVEKRPLGRPSEASSLPDSANIQGGSSDVKADSFDTSDEGMSKDNDAQLPEQPLPAELDSTLLSIETNSVGGSHDDHVAESAPPETTNATPVKPEAPPPVPSPAVETSASSPNPIRTITSTSIPQQYKVQTGVSEEAPVGAIYDSQPLMHPADKRPGWQLIVAILGILILGAAGGAAVYYLGLL